MTTQNIIIEHDFGPTTIQGRYPVRIVDCDDKTIIILTELRDNPGMSVTNCIQELAASIVNEHDLNPVECVFVEHYEKHDSFDWVELEWSRARHGWVADNPSWMRVQAETLEIEYGVGL